MSLAGRILLMAGGSPGIGDLECDIFVERVTEVSEELLKPDG